MRCTRADVQRTDGAQCTRAALGARRRRAQRDSPIHLRWTVPLSLTISTTHQNTHFCGGSRNMRRQRLSGSSGRGSWFGHGNVCGRISSSADNPHHVSGNCALYGTSSSPLVSWFSFSFADIQERCPPRPHLTAGWNEIPRRGRSRTKTGVKPQDNPEAYGRAGVLPEWESGHRTMCRRGRAPATCGRQARGRATLRRGGRSRACG